MVNPPFQPTYYVCGGTGSGTMSNLVAPFLVYAGNYKPEIFCPNTRQFKKFSNKPLGVDKWHWGRRLSWKTPGLSQNVELNDDDFSDDNALPLLDAAVVNKKSNLPGIRFEPSTGHASDHQLAMQGATIAARHAQPPDEDRVMSTSEIEMHRAKAPSQCNIPKKKSRGDSSPGDFAKFLVNIDGQVRSVELGNLKKRKKDE